MAEIAGGRPASCGTNLGVRTVDAMTADPLEQRIRDVRHMTVEALAASRFRSVMRMSRDIGLHCCVALQASLIAIHAGFELVSVTGIRMH